MGISDTPGSKGCRALDFLMSRLVDYQIISANCAIVIRIEYKGNKYVRVYILRVIMFIYIMAYYTIAIKN